MNDYNEKNIDADNNSKVDKARKVSFDPISLLLLVLGLALLALGIYFLVEPKIQNNKQDAAAEDLLELVEGDVLYPTITFRSDELIVNGEEDQEETFYTRKPIENETGTTSSATEAINDNKVVTVYGMGSIRIPVINLTMPLADNTDVYSLRVAIGHYPSSALPQEIGTGVYFGHRMASHGRYFNRLNEVSVGSEVHIDYQGKRYTYTVDKNYIVPVEELGSAVFRENITEQRILLVTCHPLNATPGQSPERILVEGYLTNISG